MSNIELLANALEYIENHLDLKITTQDVERHCYCSKSTLEKLFRCIIRRVHYRVIDIGIFYTNPAR